MEEREFWVKEEIYIMAYMLCVCVLRCVRFGQSELAIYVLALVNSIIQKLDA